MSDSIKLEVLRDEMRAAQASSNATSTHLKLHKWVANLDAIIADNERQAGSLRQVPDVLVKANDEIGNCPLRSPARSIAIRQFQELAGEYVRRLIDEASPATPTSGDDAAMEAWHSAVNDAGELFSNAPDQRFASRSSRVVTYLKNHKPEATPAQAGAELPELPKPFDTEDITELSGTKIVGTRDLYTADQMREYAQAYSNQQLAEVREDAERYRWLRGEGFDRPAEMWVTNFITKLPIVHTDLDAAIDAARRGGS